MGVSRGVDSGGVTAYRFNISIPQTLYRRVRELARARKQPVDDVLVEVLD